MNIEQRKAYFAELVANAEIAKSTPSEIDSLMWGDDQEARLAAIDDAILDVKAKRDRCLSSERHFSVPDYSQGGTCSFWVNEDGKFESYDSRISDAQIREWLRLFARDGE